MNFLLTFLFLMASKTVACPEFKAEYLCISNGGEKSNWFFQKSNGQLKIERTGKKEFWFKTNMKGPARPLIDPNYSVKSKCFGDRSLRSILKGSDLYWSLSFIQSKYLKIRSVVKKGTQIQSETLICYL